MKHRLHTSSRAYLYHLFFCCFVCQASWNDFLTVCMVALSEKKETHSDCHVFFCVLSETSIYSSISNNFCNVFFWRGFSNVTYLNFAYFPLYTPSFNYMNYPTFALQTFAKLHVFVGRTEPTSKGSSVFFYKGE